MIRLIDSGSASDSSDSDESGDDLVGAWEKQQDLIRQVHAQFRGKNCGNLGRNHPGITVQSIINMVIATRQANSVFFDGVIRPSMLDIGAGDGREALTLLKAGLVQNVKLIEKPDKDIIMNCEPDIKANMQNLDDAQKQNVEVVWADVCAPDITFDGFEWVYCSAPVDPAFWSVVLLKTLLSKDAKMITAPIPKGLESIGIKQSLGLGKPFQTTLATEGASERQHVSIRLDEKQNTNSLKNWWWDWWKNTVKQKELNKASEIFFDNNPNMMEVDEPSDNDLQAALDVFIPLCLPEPLTAEQRARAERLERRSERPTGRRASEPMSTGQSASPQPSGDVSWDDVKAWCNSVRASGAVYVHSRLLSDGSLYMEGRNKDRSLEPDGVGNITIPASKVNQKVAMIDRNDEDVTASIEKGKLHIETSDTSLDYLKSIFNLDFESFDATDTFMWVSESPNPGECKLDIAKKSRVVNEGFRGPYRWKGKCDGGWLYYSSTEPESSDDITEKVLRLKYPQDGKVDLAWSRKILESLNETIIVDGEHKRKNQCIVYKGTKEMMEPRADGPEVSDGQKRYAVQLLIQTVKQWKAQESPGSFRIVAPSNGSQQFWVKGLANPKPVSEVQEGELIQPVRYPVSKDVLSDDKTPKPPTKDGWWPLGKWLTAPIKDTWYKPKMSFSYTCRDSFAWFLSPEQVLVVVNGAVCVSPAAHPLSAPWLCTTDFAKRTMPVLYTSMRTEEVDEFVRECGKTPKVKKALGSATPGYEFLNFRST